MKNTGIFSNPDKLQRVRELNLQQNNSTVDPAVLLLKPVIEQIKSIKENASAPVKASTKPQTKSDDVKIIRDDLIVIKNAKYGVVSTPKYTRLVVYPTKEKDGYIQDTRSGVTTTSEYLLSGESSQERIADAWKKVNYLGSISSDVPEPQKEEYVSHTGSPVVDSFLDIGVQYALDVASILTTAKGKILGESDDKIQSEIDDIQKSIPHNKSLESTMFESATESARLNPVNVQSIAIGGTSTAPPRKEPSYTSEYYIKEKLQTPQGTQYLAGSIVGSIAANIIPVGRFSKVLAPIKTKNTLSTAHHIAESTIPKGVAYAVEPVKGHSQTRQ